MSSLPSGLTASPLSVDDAADLAVLLQLVDLRTLGQIETSPADLRAVLADPAIDPATNGVVVRDADGLVVGYVLAEPWSPGHLLVSSGSHPEFWDDDSLDRWLLLEGVSRAAAIARRSGDAPATAVVFAAEGDVRLDLLDELGFEEVGIHWRMEVRFERRAPDIPLPTDVTLRHPEDEADLRMVHDLLTRAFATHAGRRVETWEQFRRERIEHPAFDRRLWFVAHDADGTPAGAVLGTVDDLAGSGWVGLLGVLPEHRSRGIGTALLFAVFRAFHQQGCGRVELGVDATAEDAPPPVERRSDDGFDGPGNRVTALYERAGMRPTFSLTRHHLPL